MWRTKANQVSTRDWVCVPILLCINSAMCHVLQGNYAMKLFRNYVQGADASQPFLPSPFGTVQVLSVAGPNKTVLLSSSGGARLAHGPGHTSDTGHVSAQPHRVPVQSWKPVGSQQLPDSPCLSSLPQPLFPEAWRDIFQTVRSLWQMICMIRMLATLMLNICLPFFLLSHFLIHCNITRQHKVLVYASVFLASLKKFNVLKTAGTT